jgi:HEAT repeat protein
MIRLPLSLLLWTLLSARVALAAGPAAAPGDAVKWGEAVGGLRVGIWTAAEDVVANDPPRFRVVLQNVSKDRLALPAPTAYVATPHESAKGFRARPLKPVIERVAGAEPSYGMTGGPDLLADVSPGGRHASPTDLTLEPGASLELKDVPLEEHSFAPGHDDYGGKTTLTQRWLLPDSTYRVRFAFDNPGAARPGQWAGKAVSGAHTVRVTRPPVRDKLAAKFTLAKREYFVGEPIWVTFTVVNEGNAQASFPTGGDYRGTGRHERFSFTATSVPRNREAPDPVPPGMMFGGLGGTHTLKPGETYSETLLLNNFRALSEEGEYAVTARRTLNLSSGMGDAFYREDLLPALVVETKLNVLLRRDERALAKYVDLLVERLKDPQGREALREMRALAQAKFDAAFPALDAMLRDENPHRLEAVQWVSHYDPARAAPPLLEAAKKGRPEVRAAALEVLVKWNVPESGKLVAEALASVEARERQSAVLLCSRNPATARGSLTALIALADDPDPIVRRYLGQALGESGDQRAVPALRKLLSDTSDPHIPLWAALGLDKLGNKEGVPAIVRLLKDERLKAAGGTAIPLLQQLTGKNFKTDEDWLAWWEAQGKSAYPTQ